MDQRENDAAEEDFLATIIVFVLGVSGLLLMGWAWFALYHQFLSPFNLAIFTSIIMGDALLAWAEAASFYHNCY